MNLIEQCNENIKKSKNKLQEFVSKFDKRHIAILEELYYSDFHTNNQIYLYKPFLRNVSILFRKKGEEWKEARKEFIGVIYDLYKNNLMYRSVIVEELGHSFYLSEWIKINKLDIKEKRVGSLYRERNITINIKLTDLGISLFELNEGIILNDLNINEIDI